MIALAKELSRQRSCAIRACEDAFLASRGSPARSNALRILDANECLRLRQESRRSLLVQFAFVRAGLAGRCIDEVRRALKGVSDVLRTVPPPDGISVRGMGSALGSKRIIVFGFTPDSLYQTIPSGVMAMPYGFDVGPPGEFHIFTSPVLGSRRPRCPRSKSVK